MGLYWTIVAYSSIVGTAMSVVTLMVLYLVFGNEVGWEHVVDSFARGVALGALTSVMVVVGTLVTSSHLNTGWGKGLFIVLSFLSPLAGWALLQYTQPVLVGWEFLFDLPWMPALLSVGAGVVAAFATFFMPSSKQNKPSEGDAVAALLESRDPV